MKAMNLTVLKLLLVELGNADDQRMQRTIREIVQQEFNASGITRCCKPEHIIWAESKQDNNVTNVLEKSILAHEEQVLMVISKKKQFKSRGYERKKRIKVALPMQSDIVVTYYVRVKPERRQQFYANFLRSSLCAVGIRILKRVQYILDVSQKQATYQTAA